MQGLGEYGLKSDLYVLLRLRACALILIMWVWRTCCAGGRVLCGVFFHLIGQQKARIFRVMEVETFPPMPAVNVSW